ncbi:hypothetical protein BH10ACT1_BH10ACT1_40910 [soil metagenome]
MDDRTASGQVVPILALLLLFAGVVGVGLVHVAAAASQRAAAEAAADATALAGAADGREAAEEVAGANDARLVSYRTVGDDVLVTVERHGATGRARARWVLAAEDP